MIITVQGFAGIAPMLAPHALQPNQAQTALDCRLWTGGIEPVSSGSAVTTVAAAGVKETIYKFGQSSANPTDANWWFTWPNEVSCVKGLIASDTQERTFYTDGVQPRYTDTTKATVGGLNNYPASYFILGVPAPSNAPTLTITGGSSDGVAETRAYVTTFVTANGDEGAPSDAATIDVYPGQTVSLTELPSAPSGAYNITLRNIYRTSTGNGGTDFYFVKSIASSLTVCEDDVASTDLGEPIPSMDNEVPNAGLRGLVALSNGVMAGFVGNDIFFCEPFKPYAWPSKYSLTVDYPIVALAALQQNIVVLTKGTPYMVTVQHPDSAAMQKLDIHQACVSSRSVAQFRNGVVYASPDGLVYVGTDGTDVLTKNWFTRDLWQKLNPASLCGAQHDARYYGFFKGATLPSAPANGGFILDPDTQLGTFTLTSIAADSCYADLLSDALFYSVGSTIYKWGTGAAMPYVWVSKVFQMPQPINFSAAQVIASDYVSVTAKFYVDGSLKHTQVVTSDAPFRLPSGFKGSRFELRFEGTSVVIACHVANSIMELKGA